MLLPAPLGPITATEAITSTNPFSSICGRVCDAPCEPACRRVDSDGAVQIRNLKRFVMDKLGATYRPPAAPVTRKQSIGIVGAGYSVYVYEMTDRLGGMMIWGIPAFRLPHGIIDEDVERLMQRCPGLEVRLGTALGRDVSLAELKERHDAVLLTIGAWWGKPMGIPGEDDERVVDGVGFLRRVNAGERPEMPETVVVVGGGDVAMDACRVAKRLPGCKHVKVIYRRGPGEIPAREIELHHAVKDAAKLKAMLDRRMRLRENPFPEERPACLDDLVFLPANLSRLVIDPYREACKISWRLGERLDLDIPFFVAGFDEANEELKVAVDRGAAAAGALGAEWPELRAAPDLSLVHDTIATLRRLKQEEMIDIAWFGGARSGTDAAKLVGLGVNAIGYGVAVALALGGEITQTGMRFAPDRNEEERAGAVVNILKANAGEASMMARCAGKTRLHNIEPEDLRSVTRATAAATGIPLAGTRAA